MKLWVLSKESQVVQNLSAVHTWWWFFCTYMVVVLLYIHGGGFSCSIVTQEGGDLSLIKVQTQSIDRHLVSLTVHLLQISDGHT